MIPVRYSYRNLLVRWRTTLMTAVGFTLVVMALVVMLALINGIRTVTAVTGEPDNVLVLNERNPDEVLSRLDIDTVRQIEAAPGIRRNSNNRKMVSREIFLVLQPSKSATSETGFLQMRGVTPVALDVHVQVKVVRGQLFRPYHREVILGAGVARELELDVGDSLDVGRKKWEVVGIFDSGGTTFDSEIWCEVHQLAEQFHRQANYSSVVMRTASPAAAQAAIDFLADSRQIDVMAVSETEYYSGQAEQLAMVRTGVLVIGIFMAIGTVFGVTNTMFAAIGQRIKDIAVMRILGYSKYQILICFLLEAMLIAIVGGALGSMMGYAVNGFSVNTALGTKLIAFAFEVDAPILITAAVFTLTMGFVGGMLPAFAAMRVTPLEAMR